jgi:hypothetical protein
MGFNHISSSKHIQICQEGWKVSIGESLIFGSENPDFHIRKRMIYISTSWVALPVRNQRSRGNYEDGILGELGYTANLQPVYDVLPVQLNGLHSHVEARGDLLCAFAFSQQFNA